MAELLEVPLFLLTSTLDNGLTLTEGLFHPEISRWGSRNRPSTRAVAESLRVRIERMSPLEVTRRLPPEQSRLVRWTLELPPPRRSFAWQGKLQLQFHALVYPVASSLAAYVPALQSELFAPDEAGLEETARSELLEELLRRRLNRLDALVFLQRVRTLVASEFPVLARRRTLRQLAACKSDNKPPAVLRQVATDLSVEKLTPIYERTPQLDRLAAQLTGKNPRSVLLVGPSGVGKSALFRELARRRRDYQFEATPFWETSGARLMAGQVAFGKWQERCRRLIAEAGRTRAIVHLGNLMELCQVARHETNPFGMAGFLRPALARGELLAVVECLPEQLGQLEKEQPHLLEAFVRLDLEEPSREEVLSILLQCACDLGFTGPTETALRVESFHRRFAAYSAFPGRALRFLRALVQHDREATPAEAARAFHQETGLPLWLLDESIRFNSDHARDWFSSRVLGQPQATSLVVDRLAALKAGLTRPDRPIASFLLIGPTGVGKTETARALAEYLFSDRTRLVRFDMSEFSDPWAVERLIGPEGLLTARVREHPFSVVLFDELEKAHPDFFDLLLQVLGEARLTDAAGRLADFTNSVVLMTSNLGAQEYQKGSLGLRSQSASAEREFTEAVRAALRPELFNRIDQVLAYEPLSPETVLAIARRELQQVGAREGVASRPVRLELADQAARRLAEMGYDPRYGARPLKRALERELLAPLAEELNRHPPELPLDVSVQGDLQLTTSLRPTGYDPLARARWAGTSVDRISSTRRLGRQVQSGPLVTAVHNELHAQRKRQRRQQPVYHPGQGLLERLSQWLSQVEQLEEKALLQFSESRRGGAFDAEQLLATQSRAESELDALLLDFYERQKPGRLATLGIFGERSELVLTLARAYASLAGPYGWKLKVESVRIRKGDPSDPLERRPENDSFLAGQSSVLGILLGFEGRLAAARLLGESGPQAFMRGDELLGLLVAVQAVTLEDYRPPEGVHRRGFTSHQGRQRLYNPEGRTVTDPAIALNRIWTDNLGTALGALIDERLRREVLEAALP